MKVKQLKVKRTYLQNVVDFTNKFAAYAIETEKSFGLPAEAVLAQAALETGWGSKILTVQQGNVSTEVETNNIFNIKVSKDWTGAKGIKTVWEDDDKDGERSSDEYQICWFKIYNNIQDSFNDYAKLITENQRYKPALEAAKNNNTYEYVRQLQRCGYATDGLYAQKILSIIESNWTISFIDVVERRVSEEQPSEKEDDRRSKINTSQPTNSRTNNRRRSDTR